MDNRKPSNEIFDVSIERDFSSNEIVVVPGNFYASANVMVQGLKVGGNIYLYAANSHDSPVIDASFVHCNGMICMRNFDFCVDVFAAGEGLSIVYNGPVEVSNITDDTPKDF